MSLAHDLAPLLGALRREEPQPVFREAYVRGRSVWSEVPLTAAQFYSHLWRLGCCGMLPPRHDELYLCAACALGRTNAHRCFERAYFPALRSAIQRLLKSPHAVEEVLQDVRSRLFVGQSPKIATYRGDGPLGGWLRSVGVHAARDHQRAERARRESTYRLAEQQRAQGAHELMANCTDEQLLEADRMRRFQLAWSSAVNSLERAERQLLYNHFVRGLSIDVLGGLYSVHRATVARRVRRATGRVAQRVRAALSPHYVDWSEQDLDRLALDACCQLDIGAALLVPEEERGESS